AFPDSLDLLLICVQAGMSVEAEMNKVSWPSRSELARAAMVVMVTMFGLAAVLYTYDLVWQTLLTALGILKRG
ncbi:MAG: preprotein translocase subunit SecE, partial [Pirellulales bacterium]